MGTARNEADFPSSHGRRDGNGPDPAVAARLVEAVRARSPRIHCLTNSVARAFTANVLLALGALPSMSSDAEEVGEFVAGADALLINLGTLDAGMRAAIAVAWDAAEAAGIPVVLDPVFADRSAARTTFARALIERRPRALRCNAREAEALGRDALSRAIDRGVVVARTGATNVVSAAGRTSEFRAGHPLMDKVTAMGCAQGAVIAAFLAVGEEPFGAVESAILAFGAAGASAGGRARGPGSFAPAFLDALHALDSAALGRIGAAA